MSCFAPKCLRNHRSARHTWQRSGGERGCCCGSPAQPKADEGAGWRGCGFSCDCWWRGRRWGTGVRGKEGTGGDGRIVCHLLSLQAEKRGPPETDGHPSARIAIVVIRMLSTPPTPQRSSPSSEVCQRAARAFKSSFTSRRICIHQPEAVPFTLPMRQFTTACPSLLPSVLQRVCKDLAPKDAIEGTGLPIVGLKGLPPTVVLLGLKLGAHQPASLEANLLEAAANLIKPLDVLPLLLLVEDFRGVETEDLFSCDRSAFRGAAGCGNPCSCEAACGQAKPISGDATQSSQSSMQSQNSRPVPPFHTDTGG